MKKIMMKFCDERKCKFCIRTIVVEDEITRKRFVCKSNIYPEGREHIQRIFDNRRLLEKAYPDAEICPVQMNGSEELQFDYIEGTSLEAYYRNAVMQNNRKEVEKLLLQHADLIAGGEENRCEFVMTPQFQNLFKMDEWNGSMQGIKTANFDANAGNIIYCSGKPVFIDYEWVFDFPLPEDLVIYYNIHDAYQHIRGLEELYPFAEAMKLLGISVDEETGEKISSGFFSYVYRQDDGVSFALCKYMCAKGSKTYQDYDFIVKSWQDAAQANALLSKRIQTMEAAQEDPSSPRFKQMEAEIQERKHQTEVWRTAYETVVNSKTWRIANKMKKLFGRKIQQ